MFQDKAQWLFICSLLFYVVPRGLWWFVIIWVGWLHAICLDNINGIRVKLCMNITTHWALPIHAVFCDLGFLTDFFSFFLFLSNNDKTLFDCQFCWLDHGYTTMFYLPQREARGAGCLPPVWNLRAVIWFPFPISSHFSAWSSCSFCLVVFLLMVHSPDFFPENSATFSFTKYTFFVWLLLSSLEIRVEGGMSNLLPYSAGICHYAFM